MVCRPRGQHQCDDYDGQTTHIRRQIPEVVEAEQPDRHDHGDAADVVCDQQTYFEGRRLPHESRFGEGECGDEVEVH